jgi:exodeoxyribonuclease VII large subunit
MGASDGRVWLTVPYHRKDEAKHLGARWSPHALLWYAPDKRYTDLIERFPFDETERETHRRHERIRARSQLTA